MFKSRRKICEEEAKKDPNYRPTKDLEVDESQLSDEEKGHFELPLTAIIIFGVIIVLVILCFVMINIFGGPVVTE